ncbi:MAG: iron-containing alcohol dehydrogenase [Rhodothermales bacterium]|nr:iron-containing alcohol dehydrogenase [Rhodothermales bacterium]MBO6778217.1 iron-containing alcohol dehydrogenase [Rhodothermales bacterium]
MLSKLPEVLSSYDAGTALVITDPGVASAGIADRVCGLTETAGFRPVVWDRVRPNPRTSTVDEVAARYRDSRVRVVVGIGGGSVLDAAKGIALMLQNSGPVAQYQGRNRFPNGSAPFVAIPTTCGTGSEVTWVSVLTSEAERRKISVKGDRMFPAWAIADSELLASLPEHLIATTAMDAATHAVEAAVGRQANPASDALAAGALRRILDHLESAVERRTPKSLTALMEASTLAGMAFGNADVAGVHCLSEAIGGRHDLPHGALNAALLVPVLRYQEREAAGKLNTLGEACGTPDLLSALETLSRAVGIPSFRELRVPREDYEPIAREAEQNGSNGSNPRTMTAADYLAILREL